MNHDQEKKEKQQQENLQVSQTQGLDSESEVSLRQIADYQRILSKRISGVKTVLIVLSASGMVFDIEALRQKISLAYPNSEVFFRTTLGKPVGFEAPRRVDLLIDFTGPGQRQGWFYARALRSMSRYAVGRNAGFFRKKIYDRVFDEKRSMDKLPKDMLARERVVQKQVLAMIGVPIVQISDTPPDRGKSIALELPSMQKL